jgi:hypothetical protein
MISKIVFHRFESRKMIMKNTEIEIDKKYKSRFFSRKQTELKILLE